MIWKFAAASVAALLLAACGSAPAPETTPAPSEETVRQTAQGEAIGFTGEDGVMIWRGLPFAAPPVGDLRWRAPRPPAVWTGRRNALSFASACAQITNVFNASNGGAFGTLQGSEDCLYLNIYAPAETKPGANLPVMVWIHGGNNVSGSAKQYIPAKLAANENVVIVTVQYRLGPLGWFAHEAIRGSAETPDDASANFGTLDLIQSLQWVKENIAGFGGDPGLVTIFGESAGGQNVASLIVSPLASGLFDRAIIQSGLFDSYSLADAETSASDKNAAANAVIRMGVSDAAALRALSAQQVFDAYVQDEGNYLTAPRVIADGVAIPQAGLRTPLKTPGGFNAVPVITGTNRDEMKLFQFLDPRLVNKWFGVFVVARDQKFYDALAHYQSRLWRIRSVDEPASAMTAAGHEAVYAYRFDWDEGGRFLITDLKKLLGAAHGMDIPFVLDRFELFGRLDPLIFRKASAASREKLARDMGAYWAAFARDGDPGAGGSANLARWPRWTSDGATLKRFDTDGADALTGLDTIDALVADLAADHSVTAEQKRIIADALSGWMPERAGDFAAAAE
jgi:para-nitrobenzyl esterase